MYFDTNMWESYLLTARGRNNRFKVRTRTYVDSALSFLEVKTQNKQGMTIKERIPYSNNLFLNEEGTEYVNTQLTKTGFSNAQGLQPVVATSYTRATLLLPDATRVTIDNDLQWSYDDEVCELLDHYIVETKTSGKPGLLDKIL